MKKIVRIKYCIFTFVILCLCSIFAQTYGAYLNTLSLVPDGNVYTGKYFCELPFSVVAEYGGAPFVTCEYGINYDASILDLELVNIGMKFNSIENSLVETGFWYTSLSSNNNEILKEKSECAFMKLNVKSTHMTGSLIRFVDSDGNIINQVTGTNDGLSLSYGGTDTLKSVNDMQISYELCPCTLDGTNDKPKFGYFSHNFSANSHYTGLQTIKFLVYDKGGSSWSYWTSGVKLNTVMQNGLPYAYTGGAPAGMDNQEGINSGTIKVTLTSPDGTQVLTNGNGLTITRYTGTLANTPEYTWDGNDRGYRVTFTGNFDVETPVSISIEVYDNALSNGSVCQTSAHKGTYSATINQKEAPIITLKTPINNAQNINPYSPIVVEVSDSWAGVNTGSVKITIPAIYSGSELLMTGYTYSGSDLSFELISGTSELGGASKYNVTFQPKYKFPTSTGISVTGYVEDLVSMTGVLNRSFNTRADCSFYGCVNYVDIFFGDFVLENLQIGEFTGSLIVITGSIAPYPYLTGENNDIVMCGPIDETIILSGNVDIYSGTQIINGQKYLYSGLYVTGLDFVYDPENGVITPIY